MEIINRNKLDDVEGTLFDYVELMGSTFQSNPIITSGGRSKQDQIRIYKKKFGKDWEDHIAWNSAHLFEPGKTKAQAVDFRIQDVFPTKIHAITLDLVDMFNIKGIGLDIFNNYLHVDRKDRGMKNVLLWIYERSGEIVYL
jgi:hypothetical protein